MGLIIVLSAGALGCGGGSNGGSTPEPLQPPRELEITLDGAPGPENLGILMAQKRGYFKDVGLEVTVHQPIGPRRPVLYVADKEVDLGVSHEPQVAVAQENGVPIVAVASLVPRPTAAMIWLKGSKIHGIADLKGKTIAIPGLPFERGLLQSVLARAGLTPGDVKVEAVEYDLVQALARGRADAIFGGSWSVEGVELAKRGLKPVVKRMQSLGVPAYEELVLIVRRDRLDREPRSIRNFIAAMNRGTAAAIEDPRAAVEAIVEADKELAGVTASVPLVEAEVEEVLPLLSATGRMNAGEAERLVTWMRGQGLLGRRASASALLTNNYLTEFDQQS